MVYAAHVELHKNKPKLELKNVKPKPGETLFLYSTGLEGLFKNAYSSPKADTTRALTDQFECTVKLISFHYSYFVSLIPLIGEQR